MPAATDLDLAADWWAVEDVLTYLTSQGHPITANTWTAYVARGRAPAAERRFGRAPVWSPDTITTWHAARRGLGWRAGQKGTPA